MSASTSFSDTQTQQYGKELFTEMKRQMPDMTQVKWLIDRADLKMQDGNGNTALMLVSGWGRVDFMEQMVARGADVNQPDRNGNTVVHFVLRSGNEAMIDFVLEKNGNIAQQNFAGSTPLDFAQDKISPELMDRIRKKFIELDPENVRLRAIHKYIDEQGVRVSKDIEAPSKAQFRPRPRH